MSVPFAAPRMSGHGHNAGRAVAREFAYGDKARNSNGQFYTDGRTIWSYGPHWPLATRLEDGSYLVNVDYHSRTTTKHLSWVRFALSQHSDATIHTVDDTRNFWAEAARLNGRAQ